VRCLKGRAVIQDFVTTVAQAVEQNKDDFHQSP
jgi:hypothetical protein